MAGMDLSFRRNDRGSSAFWRIFALGAAVALVIVIAVIGSETDREAMNDPAGFQDDALSGEGTAPEGFADTAENEMLDQEGAQSFIEQGAGADLPGGVIDEGAPVADTGSAPERGVTDSAARGAEPAEGIDPGPTAPQVGQADADGGPALQAQGDPPTTSDMEALDESIPPEPALGDDVVGARPEAEPGEIGATEDPVPADEAAAAAGEGAAADAGTRSGDEAVAETTTPPAAEVTVGPEGDVATTGEDDQLDGDPGTFAEPAPGEDALEADRAGGLPATDEGLTDDRPYAAYGVMDEDPLYDRPVGDYEELRGTVVDENGRDVVPLGVDPGRAEELRLEEEGPTELVVDPDDGAPVDPDGGAGAFFPTPSGPEGRDGNPLTAE